MSLSVTKRWRDVNKNLEHLLGLSYRVYFGVFTLSVRVKHFQVDLVEWKMIAPSPSLGIVHMWVVCT
jgi:hypothetical protein